MCVCVLRGVRGGPIDTSGGRFPPNACMEGDQETWGRLLLEMHLDGRQGRFGRTWGPADPTLAPLILLWQADRWVSGKAPDHLPYVHLAGIDL